MDCLKMYGYDDKKLRSYGLHAQFYHPVLGLRVLIREALLRSIT